MLDCIITLRRGDWQLQCRQSFRAPITGIVGPSGCGKSTLLQSLCGLLRPQSGRIVLNERVLFDHETRIDIPVHRRNIGMIFQNDRLFPHLDVRRNLLYARRARRLRGDGRFDEIVDLLGIEALLARPVLQCSGGERRRIAIGRALLQEPELLLCDEPLTGLDRERKREIMPYLARLRAHCPAPILFVSHDEQEIAELVNHVVFMRDGRICGSCSPLACRLRA